MSLEQQHCVAIRAPPNALQQDPDIEEDIKYHVTPAPLIAEKQLVNCSVLFTNWFGLWNETAPVVLGPERARAHGLVIMSEDDLKKYFIPEGATTVLITAVTCDDRQIAHCFISQWVHEGTFVFWITQMVVDPRYRNQRRATKMLQAFTQVNDIGSNPSRRDIIGTLSPHPYAIAAILRVFSHGIESLPSKPDWQARPYDYPRAPLRGKFCESILASSPCVRVSTAQIHPSGTSAYTKLHINLHDSQTALDRIQHSMNALLLAPWECLFGTLADGCEYVCILEYRHDETYTMHPRVPDRGPECLNANNWRGKWCDDFYELEQHFQRLNNQDIESKEHPSCFGVTDIQQMTQRLDAAYAALDTHADTIIATMDAKRVPDGVRRAFSTGKWDGERRVWRRVPEEAATWGAFKVHVWEVWCGDGEARLRVEMLQAVHWLMLGEECARVRIREGKGEEEDDVAGDEMELVEDFEEKGEIDEVVDMFCVAKIVEMCDASSSLRR
ncbi:hypothetical protein FB567DRAFT_620209 [Paraphoma chrysanthemicola]|uniref:N-acetyltransferase domain-containing protein n=1 Tax=Paraphoma chrysanthemicola TaxID=798071 RepID=A0A8K0R8N5_9PLEO|nr:hypothetical protein FB567DRAFT_620209 [Paraphoma chrysanthemicola]